MLSSAQKPRSVYVLNGPNLNLLGVRQPHIYGATTLADVQTMVSRQAENLGLAVTFRQTNHEGVLVDWVQESRTEAEGLILNAGAYTHTSVALHDALLAVEKPIIEVHLSNPHTRENFRHFSYVSGPAKREIAGFGALGYVLAIEAMAQLLVQQHHEISKL
jgi:3-dehydroquinate dehydratase-2